MTVLGYLVIATEAEAVDIETAIGKVWAASLNKPWPVPPDNNPSAPPEECQAFYRAALRSEQGNPIVLEVDQAIHDWHGAQATGADGTTLITLDTRPTTRKTFGQLPPDAVATLAEYGKP